MIHMVEYCGPTGGGIYDATYQLNTGIELGGVNGHDGEGLYNFKLYDNGTGMEIWCITDHLLKIKRHRVVLESGRFMQPVLVRKLCPDGSYLVWSPTADSDDRFLTPTNTGTGTKNLYRMIGECAREIDAAVGVDDLGASVGMVFPGIGKLNDMRLYCQTDQSHLDMIGSEIINMAMEELHPEYIEAVTGADGHYHGYDVDQLLVSSEAVLSDMDFTAENLPEWDPNAVLEIVPTVPDKNRPVGVCSGGGLFSWKDLCTNTAPLAVSSHNPTVANNGEFEDLFRQYFEPFNAIMRPALSLPSFSLTSDQVAVTYPGVTVKMGAVKLKYRRVVRGGVQILFTKDRSEEGQPVLITESLFASLFEAVAMWMPKIDCEVRGWVLYKKTSEELVLEWRNARGVKRLKFDLFRYAVVADSLVRMLV